MVTEHAKANSRKYVKFLSKPQARRFSKAVIVAMGKRESTSVVIALDKAVRNDYRDDWARNDRLVAIIRHNDLVTVMLSRAEQMHKRHLRTDRIVYA